MLWSYFLFTFARKCDIILLSSGTRRHTVGKGTGDQGGSSGGGTRGGSGGKGR